MKALSEVAVGKSVQIVSVTVKPKILERLAELGLFPGAVVEVRHVGPVGRDPLAVFVRGSLVALRREDAGNIQVEERS